MARYTGISSATPVNLIVDAGAVYINYGEVDQRLLGATRGGSTFVVNQEFRDVQVDGLPGPVAGMSRIISVDATMEVNMLEFSTENLLLAFPGAEAVDYPESPATKTHDSIRRSRNILTSDFLTNIALVGTLQGNDEPVICILYNAMQKDNFTLSRADQDESVATLTFHGHFDLTDFDNEPWEVRYPVVA
jgi:hypothetical protein